MSSGIWQSECRQRCKSHHASCPIRIFSRSILSPSVITPEVANVHDFFHHKLMPLIVQMSLPMNLSSADRRQTCGVLESLPDNIKHVAKTRLISLQQFRHFNIKVLGLTESLGSTSIGESCSRSGLISFSACRNTDSSPFRFHLSDGRSRTRMDWAHIQESPHEQQQGVLLSRIITNVVGVIRQCRQN